ncbi:hypothetical protein FB451DRAFT_1418041 [Mycena latifolia]|nr:hypothetical protein FB451DRAFT_1418041 [Mycena latifolia]
MSPISPRIYLQWTIFQDLYEAGYTFPADPPYTLQQTSRTPHPHASYARLLTSCLSALTIDGEDLDLILHAFHSPAVCRRLLKATGRYGLGNCPFRHMEAADVQQAFMLYIGAYMATAPHAYMRLKACFDGIVPRMVKRAVKALAAKRQVKVSSKRTRTPGEKKWDAKESKSSSKSSQRALGDVTNLPPAPVVSDAVDNSAMVTASIVPALSVPSASQLEARARRLRWASEFSSRRRRAAGGAMVTLPVASNGSSTAVIDLHPTPTSN